MSIEPFVEATVVLFEGLGVAIMPIGFVIAAVVAIRSLLRDRDGARAFHLLRTLIGSSLLLGLEVLVAADLIRTILAPSFADAAMLGIIVAIRTVLSVSIQIEIEGVLPWRRALLQSGGQVFAETVKRDRGSAEPTAAPSNEAKEVHA